MLDHSRITQEYNFTNKFLKVEENQLGSTGLHQESLPNFICKVFNRERLIPVR
jgi:hypothetical protein